MGLREQFTKYGYIHLKHVFSPEEVQSYRKKIDSVFERIEQRHDIRTLRLSHILEEPDLASLPFRPSITQSAREALDAPVYMYGDWGIQKNGFGDGDPKGGWHYDANSEFTQPYLWEPNYKFAKCGIYFQDNTYEWGGGVDIVPKSHTMPSVFPSAKLNRKFKSFRDRLGIKFRSQLAPLESGDVLIFDSRLWHRSSWPHNLKVPEIKLQNKIENMPQEHWKYTFYWDISDAAIVPTFLKHSRERAKNETDSARNPLFGGYLRHHYPTDFPSSFIENAEKTGISMASLDARETDIYKQKHPFVDYAEQVAGE